MIPTKIDILYSFDDDDLRAELARRAEERRKAEEAEKSMVKVECYVCKGSGDGKNGYRCSYCCGFGMTWAKRKS